MGSYVRSVLQSAVGLIPGAGYPRVEWRFLSAPRAEAADSCWNRRNRTEEAASSCGPCLPRGSSPCEFEGTGDFVRTALQASRFSASTTSGDAAHTTGLSPDCSVLLTSMRKYSVSADYPEYSAKARRRWYRNKPQREAAASAAWLPRPVWPSWSWKLVFDACRYSRKWCGKEMPGSSQFSPHRAVSPLRRPLQPRVCLGSWLSCSLELACRDLQVGTLEACSTVFRERMVSSPPKYSALTQSAQHGCPRPAPPTQCPCEVFSLTTYLLSNLLSNIYLPIIYLYTHSHIHIHSHIYLIYHKV